MAITLYLLNKKGFQVLSCLVRNKKYRMYIDLVVGAKDSGNKEDYYDEIKVLSNENSIPFLNRKADFTNKSKYSMAVGWRWLIKDVQNLIVLHDSYLPKYRGFAPVVNMLIKGENHLGVSAIWATEGMDEGEIIMQQKISIAYPMKVEKAIEKVAKLYEVIADFILGKVVSGSELTSVPQNNQDASYSIWRDEKDYFINWEDEAEKIRRFIDAVGYPYNGAMTRTAGGEIIKIYRCSIVENIVSEIRAPGKLLMFQNNMPIILCGQGKNAIKLEKFTSHDGGKFEFSKFRTRLI